MILLGETAKSLPARPPKRKRVLEEHQCAHPPLDEEAWAFLEDQLPAPEDLEAEHGVRAIAQEHHIHPVGWQRALQFADDPQPSLGGGHREELHGYVHVALRDGLVPCQRAEEDTQAASGLRRPVPQPVPRISVCHLLLTGVGTRTR